VVLVVLAFGSNETPEKMATARIEAATTSAAAPDSMMFFFVLMASS